MSGLGQRGTVCRRCHGDGFPECMCHVPPARDLDDLARVADELLAAPLERLRAEVARYSAAGPIPLRFEVEPASAGATIIAVASVVDADVYRATGALVPTTTRSRIGVALDADEAAIRRAVTAIANTAVNHEAREWLVRDGVLVDDPHRRAP